MATHKRILSALGKGPARRNLFGPVDREQLQVEYQAALRNDLEEACQRWGFDFISDKPLESSDFQWEDIPGSKVPLLYRSCMLGLGHAEGQRVAKAAVTPKEERRAGLPQSGKENIPCSPQSGKENIPCSPQSGKENIPCSPQSRKENIPCSPQRREVKLENLEKTPARRENKGLKRKQTNITDFYQAKRRVVGMPRKSGE